MDRRLKAKWLAALRSRKFKQGKGSLHQREFSETSDKIDERFCCLGVLCKVAGLEPRHPVHVGAVSYVFAKRDSSASLPANFRDKIGITDDQQDTLISMNDDENAKFYQIARWIERSL